MSENKKNENDNNEIYEDIAQAADFVHDRLDNIVEPTALNNTVEEYVREEERGIQMNNKPKNQNEEATIAPAMNTHDELEEKATDQEEEKGDSTNVTRLFVDRTPED